MDLPLLDFDYVAPVSLNAVVNISSFSQDDGKVERNNSSQSEDQNDDLLFRVHNLKLESDPAR